MPSVVPSNLRDLVNEALSLGLRGQQVDSLVCSLGVNWLDPAKPLPFLSIQLSGAPAFECFLDGKVGIVGHNWVLRFVSIYPPVPGGFPIARVYNLPLPDILEFARIGRSFEERGIKMKPLSIEEFEGALGAEGYEARIAFYHGNFWSRSEGFQALMKGRLASTSLESGIVINSKGCLRCGSEAALFTTTLGGTDGAEGLMIGFYLCPDHAKEACNDVSFYHHLCRVFGQPAPAIAGRVSFDFLADAAVEFLKNQLDCRIEKIVDRTIRKGKPGRPKEKQEVAERTITSVRASGFKVIAKLQDDGTYAYMIQNAFGIEVAVVDNTDHHDVPFGPDHLHRSPVEDRKDVESSFTYGFPQMDARIIRRILNEHGG